MAVTIPVIHLPAVTMHTQSTWL